MTSAFVTALPTAVLPPSDAVFSTVGVHLVMLPLVVLVALAAATVVHVALSRSSRRPPPLRVIHGTAPALSRDAA